MKQIFTAVSLFSLLMWGCSQNPIQDDSLPRQLEVRVVTPENAWSTRADADAPEPEFCDTVYVDDAIFVTAQIEDLAAVRSREQALTGEPGGNDSADSPVTRGTRGTPVMEANQLTSLCLNMYVTGTAKFSGSTALTTSFTATLSGGTYNLSPTYQWVENTDKHSFLAFAPVASTANGLSMDAQGHKLTYTVPTTTANQPDLCVAKPSIDKTNDPRQTLEMSHALTAVGVAFNGFDVRITSAKVTGVKTTGTLDLQAGTWSSLSGSGSYTIGTSDAFHTDQYNSGYVNATNANGYLMMIPQTFSGSEKLEIVYEGQWQQEGGTISIALKDIASASKDWSAGKRVMYNIRLKTGPAVVSGDLEIRNYRGFYTTSSPMTIKAATDDDLTFKWDASWLKIHRGSAKTGNTSGGAASPWSTGVNGFSNTTIYFFATGDNPSTTQSRTATVTVTGKKSCLKIFHVTQVKQGNSVNTPTANDYVIINGLKWAKGNLVATSPIASTANDCKIGASTDAGLFFQFGSLIGYRGGSTASGGTGEGKAEKTGYWTGGSSYTWDGEAVVWPAKMPTMPTTWQSATGSNIATMTNYFFNYSVSPYATRGQNIRGLSVSVSGDAGSGTLGSGRYASKGVGDPCTYYLGGSWRLPTPAECDALSSTKKSEWESNGTIRGYWFGPNAGNASTSIFIPASGYRGGDDGKLGNPNSFCYFWSSCVYDSSSAFGLGANPSSGVYPQYGFVRRNGFPVRCVSN